MKQLPGIVMIVVLLLCAGSGGAGRAMAQPAPPLPREANVQPQVGERGTLFRFVATGFLPQEGVGLWLNTPDGRAVDADVDDFDGANDIGRADWEWVAPLDAQPGIWQMVTLGMASGVQHVISFEIDRQTPPTIEANVQPNEAVAGTRFAFFARGFIPGETISAWLISPTGATIDDGNIRQLNEAGPSGRADWYWYSPIDSLPGTWQMVVRGDTSGVEVVIPFRVEQEV